MNTIAAAFDESVATGRKLDRGLIAIYAFYGLLIFAQLFLVFEKSINWDEFYHYSMVYDLPKGRLTWDFQTLHLRLFLWVPNVADDLITQIQIARIGMLCCEIVAVAMVVQLAQEFVDQKAALVTGIVYLAGGYVFTQGFSFRSDPISTAVLMTALCLFATRSLSIGHMVLVGVLVGLAGLMTMKSIFYAPCFMAFAISRLMSSANWRETLLRITIVPVVSMATFVVVLQLHRIGLDLSAKAVWSPDSGIGAFLGAGRSGERAIFTVQQMQLAPLIPIGVIVTAIAWRRLGRREVIVLSCTENRPGIFIEN